MPDTTYNVVAANSVDTGDTVFLTGCDEWSPDLMHAELIDEPEHADFRLFVASRQTRLVTDPALASIRFTADGPALDQTSRPRAA